MSPLPTVSWRAMSQRTYWLWPLAATMAAYASSLRFGLVGDARFLLVENRYVDGLSRWLDTLTHDYFWSSSGNSIPYWRPLTKLSWLVEHQLFGSQPTGYHLVQLAWFLLAVGGVLTLGRAVGLSRGAAAAAALLYGLSPVAMEPVCLVMARSDVTCAALTIWAIWAWLRCTQPGARRWSGPLLLGLATAGALASKEVAVILPLLLLLDLLLRAAQRRRRTSATPRGAVATTSGDTAPPQSGSPLRRPWLCLGLALLLLGGYLLARWAVLGPGRPQLALHPWRWLSSFYVYVTNLLPLRLDSSVRNIPLTEVHSIAMQLPAALLTLAVAVATWFGWRRRARLPLLWGAWALLALAPVILLDHIAVPGAQGKAPLADRWLLHALAPATLLWVQAADRLVRERWLRRGLAAALALWCGLSLVLAAKARRDFASDEALLTREERAYQATPAEHRTEQDHCRRLDRQLVAALVQQHTGQAQALLTRVTRRCGDSGNRRFNRLSLQVQQRRFGPAYELASDLLARPPHDLRNLDRLYFLAGITRVERGQMRAGRALLLRAWHENLRDCELLLYLSQACQGVGQPRQAARWMERAYRCSTRPALLLAAARMWLEIGGRARARELLQQASPLHLPPRLQRKLQRLRRIAGPHRAEPASSGPAR